VGRAIQFKGETMSQKSGFYARMKQRTIASRLLFWFLAISLIPCAILTTITARIASQSLQDSVRNNLNQIAANKADELEIYAMERVQDVAVLSRGISTINGVRELTKEFTATAGGKQKSWAQLKIATEKQPFAQTLSYFARTSGYSQLLLIDNSGLILFTLDDAFLPGTSLMSGALASSELAAGFERSHSLLQSDLCSFALYQNVKQPLAFVTSPVIDDGQVIGVLAMGFGPDRIWKTLTNMNGLGDTGEIVTGQRIGDNVLVAIPLRHNPDAAFKLKIPIGAGQSSAIQKAASGERGYGEATDYRNENVVAAWRYLPLSLIHI
jgi:methyl-accepting chemotaxis protein WspA